MDPNNCLELMLAAIANGDSETLSEFSGYLEQWVRGGGFLPSELQGIADELTEEADSIATATGQRDIDESVDGEGVEFRIFIRPGGSLELAIGDPCYDTDHRGYCGAGTIVAGDSLEDCRGATLDAFWQAVDDAACAMLDHTPTVETAAIIVARYIGPTNHRPGRILATSSSGKRLTTAWDHGKGTFENHAAAAAALAEHIGISGRRIVGGELHRAGYAFAFVPR